MENPFDILARRQDEIESKVNKILALVEGRPLEAWCSVEAAAERTGISRRQIEEAYLTGELGYTKKGRSVRLNIDEINAWMRKDYITPAEVKSGAKRVVLEVETIAQKGYTFIYLMHDPHSGLHKIGRSVTPVVREKTLVSQMPSIEIIFTSIECRIQKEKELHRMFAAKRVRGEWFNLAEEDVHLIRNYNYGGVKKDQAHIDHSTAKEELILDIMADAFASWCLKKTMENKLLNLPDEERV